MRPSFPRHRHRPRRRRAARAEEPPRATNRLVRGEGTGGREGEGRDRGERDREASQTWRLRRAADDEGATLRRRLG